ncbi:S1 family peptidase [Aquiflexum lacus]|uniref:S1 family peptidase n=1 Tax=Aquiflexum lacus TaxID=2483805 RepID=UPI0018948612|nr:serine protease [Aquiflexum lacus]
MSKINYDWSIPYSNFPEVDLGIHLPKLMRLVIEQRYPEFICDTPFLGTTIFSSYTENGVVIFQLDSLTGSNPPIFNKISDTQLIGNALKIVQLNKFPDFNYVNEVLPDQFSFTKYTFIGTHEDMKFNFLHYQKFLIDYLNNHVLPQLIELNRKRIMRVISEPPSFDINKIVNNIFVIESSSNAIQGSCFYLNGVGFVTCSHCLFFDSEIFRSNEEHKRFPVKIKKRHEVIDLAIFEVDDFEISNGLEIGDSDRVKLNDPIVVAGFPNHNYGDSGIFSPGLIIGTRQASSITRFLINAPLIAGNSGGPIISYNNKVIGVAVTGADKMENAFQTENHGVIPISAISLF